MPDETVEVLVDVRQTGLENATAVRQAVEGIGTAAGDSESSGATGKMAGLASAFQRFEAREPSRFIRQTTFALEGMALQAVGTEGPVGRLGAAFGLFAAGSGVGLVALGGFAAIAAAIHLAGAEARETEAAIAKLATTIGSEFAGLTPGFTRHADQAQELRGMLTSTTAGIRERETQLAAGVSFKEQSILERELVDLHHQRLELEKALAQAMRLGDHDRTVRERERDKLFTDSALALARASGASAAEIERLTERQDRLRLATSTLDDRDKALLLSRTTETRLLGDLKHITDEVTAALPGLTGELQQIPTRLDLAGVGGLGKARADLVPDDVALKLMARLPGGALTPGFKDFAGVLKESREALRPPERDERLGGRLATELPGLIAAFAHGDAGGGLLAGGGILETLGSSKKPGLQSLGLPGELLTAFGGLVSLFSGGKPKIDLGEDTLRRLKEMNAALIPQNYSVNLIDSRNPRATAYDLGRAARLDQTPRLPYSPS